MNIFYITNARFPTEKAHGFQIAKMCEAFSDLGHKVTIVVPKRQTHIVESPEMYYGTKTRLSIIYINSKDYFSIYWMPRKIAFLLTELSFFRKLSAWLRKNNPKIGLVITRDQFVISQIKKIWPDTALVFEAHDIGRLFFRLHRHIAQASDCIVVTNEWKQKEIQKHWGNIAYNKTITLHNAVDLSSFDGLLRMEQAKIDLGWDLSKKYVVYTGHLYTWKGVQTLVDCVKFLPNNLNVVCVGGTVEDQKVFTKILEEKKLTSRVSLIPHVSHTKVLAYLAAADCLVLPNSGKDWNARYTTSPIKIWEYLAARRPVVVSDLPSIRELVSENEVVFFTADDPESLSRAVLQALGDSLFRIENAWKKVQTHTWNARAQALVIQTQKLYGESV